MKRDAVETSNPPSIPQGNRNEFWLASSWFPLSNVLGLSGGLLIQLCVAMLNCNIYLLCQNKSVPYFQCYLHHYQNGRVQHWRTQVFQSRSNTQFSSYFRPCPDILKNHFLKHRLGVNCTQK